MIFAGSVTFIFAFHSKLEAAGPIFQASAVVSAIWTIVAAIGVWMHRRWGAYSYLALILASQVFLALMGLWTWGTPIIPIIVLLLLFVGFRRLSKGVEVPPVQPS